MTSKNSKPAIVDELNEPLLKMDKFKVPYIKLSNGIELPSLTVVPLLNLDPEQKSQVFRAAISAGYSHIDLSNVRMGTPSLISAIMDDLGHLHTDCENLFLTAKLVAEDDLDGMKQKFADLLNCLHTDHINLLMIGFSECGRRDRQDKKGIINNNTMPTNILEDQLEQGQQGRTAAAKHIDTLMKAWHVAEQLYMEGKVKALGVSRTDIKLVKQLCERAQIRPHCWQIDLAPLMANFDDVLELSKHQKLTPIIRANAMGASSKFGSQQQRGFYHTLLREMANKYAKSATQVLCRWLYQRDMAVVCSCATANRIGDQTNIFDFRISPEDMRRLNGLYNRNSIPSPYQLPQKASTSERSRHLIYACRHSAELALTFALLGITFMILAMEFGFAKWSKLDELARCAVAATTAALLGFTVRYHVLHTKYHMHVNAIGCWRSALHVRQRLQVLLELIVCALTPVPLLRFPSGGEAFACALMFLRLYWLPRVLHLRSRLCTDAAAKSIAGLNRVKTDTRFMLKLMLFLHPGPTLSTFVFCFWLVGAYILRLCESNIEDNKLLTYYNTLWMMCVTFLTIGYGDIYPVTTCGRLMAIVTGIVGVCVASMIVAVIVQKISLSQAEERVHKFMAKTKFAKSLKVTAAQVLKESWFVYKNRQNLDKLKYHQRRQSAAICALRKLRKEQRVFQEDDCASIDDVAKTILNAIELIRAQGCAQLSANDRLNTLEQKLNGIQEGINALPELLAKTFIDQK
uniref:Calmodulin-binding domain-containing protein n=1 Tax=Globodera rostochiensis TaxID=31243 RepID=A0A914HJZ7_GLORO